MKRLALACLLLLTACQKKDPEGTVQLERDTSGKLSHMFSDVIANGELPPIRFKSGMYKILSVPEGALNEVGDCLSTMTLKRFGSTEVINQAQVGFIVPNPTWNVASDGVYVISFVPEKRACKYSLIVKES